MKISEQIQYLQKVLKEKGDMEVVIRTPSEYCAGDVWYETFTKDHVYQDEMIKGEYNAYLSVGLDKADKAENVLIITTSN